MVNIIIGQAKLTSMGGVLPNTVSDTTVLFLTNASFVFPFNFAPLLLLNFSLALYFPPHSVSVPQGYTEYTHNSKGVTPGYAEKGIQEKGTIQRYDSRVYRIYI